MREGKEEADRSPDANGDEDHRNKSEFPVCFSRGLQCTGSDDSLVFRVL